MKNWYSVIRSGVAVLAAGLLLAQPATAQTRRVAQNLQLWPELQAELALKSGGYFFVALRGQRETRTTGYDAGRRHLGFDEQRLTLGYEHFWNEHWSGGGTARLEAVGFRNLVLVPEALLRHRSAVGPLTFGQRLSLERTFPNKAGYLSGPAPDGQTWARLRVDLEKSVPLGSAGFSLRPRLSYEAATHVRLLRAETDADERTVQFTSLRGELGCRVSSRVDFTPWFAYQTRYRMTLEQTDINGKVTIPGGRLNLVAPVVGLDVRFTLFQGQEADNRQQLPSQH